MLAACMIPLCLASICATFRRHGYTFLQEQSLVSCLARIREDNFVEINECYLGQLWRCLITMRVIAFLQFLVPWVQAVGNQTAILQLQLRYSLLPAFSVRILSYSETSLLCICGLWLSKTKKTCLLALDCRPNSPASCKLSSLLGWVCWVTAN